MAIRVINGRGRRFSSNVCRSLAAPREAVVRQPRIHVEPAAAFHALQSQLVSATDCVSDTARARACAPSLISDHLFADLFGGEQLEGQLAL